MSEIDKFEQHCVVGSTSVGHQPGKEFGGERVLPKPAIPTDIDSCSTVAHSETAINSKGFQKGLWSMEEHERDGVKIEREVN